MPKEAICNQNVGIDSTNTLPAREKAAKTFTDPLHILSYETARP